MIPNAPSTADVSPTFVVCWSKFEPHRVGQVAHLAPVTYAIGFDDPRKEHPPVCFAEERPAPIGAGGAPAALASVPHRIEIRAGLFGVDVSVVTPRPIWVSGTRSSQGERRALVPGDTLYIPDHTLLLFTYRRPAAPLLRFPQSAVRPFGQADALGIAGESPVVWRWRDAIAEAARSGEHVLVHGGCGTGKELAIRGIHALSERAAGPFDWRTSSELPFTCFGNGENFRGAEEEAREGLLGRVDGGTLLLDFLHYHGTDELAQWLEPVLASGGEYRRVGETQVRRSRFVVLGATNQDPSVIHPVFHRILRRSLETPSLNEHREDIPLLLGHLLEMRRDNAMFAGWLRTDEGGRPHCLLPPRAVDRLLHRDYATGGVFDLDRALGDEMRLAAQEPAHRASR